MKNKETISVVEFIILVVGLVLLVLGMMAFTDSSDESLNSYANEYSEVEAINNALDSGQEFTDDVWDYIDELYDEHPEYFDEWR